MGDEDDDNANQVKVMEDVTVNHVIADDNENEDDDEEDDEWDQHPYNFVDVSDTASETGSNVDPDIFYSIIDFDQQFEEELTGIHQDQSESLPPDLPEQDPSNNNNLNNSFSGS